MDKKTRKIVMPLLEEVLKIGVTVEVESVLSSLDDGLKKLPIGKLTPKERKKVMKAALSHGKDLVVSFFDKKLAEL